MQGLLMQNKKVNYPGPFTFCYIDDRVSIAYYFDYVDPIYPIGLTVNKTSDKVTTASYFDQHREPIMNKRKDFSFHIEIFRSKHVNDKQWPTKHFTEN
jgi:hypothetical protein